MQVDRGPSNHSYDHVVSTPSDFGAIERDLLRDRRGIPGAVDTWLSLSERQRLRWLRRFQAGEDRRAEFEQRLGRVPGATARWSDFCVTEQRELLGTVGFLLPG